MSKQRTIEKIVEELDAFSSGFEHVDESVGSVVLSLLKESYNKGRSDEREFQNPDDNAYYSMSKRKTFNQWIKKRFKV